ncbi:MAG: oligosaccharide flippase family protein, partial [Oligoflexia bacterium]|nr:oligosaccharide flippase family protein [Oligoflexia bacterium]
MNKNILLRFFSEAVINGALLLSVPILIKNLGKESYGVYLSINTIIGLLLPISTFGTSYSIINFFSGDEQKESRNVMFSNITFLVCMITLLCATLLFLSSPLIGDFFLKNEWMLSTIRLSSVLLVCTVFDNLLKDLYRAFLRFNAYTWIQVLNSTCFILIVFLVSKSYRNLNILILCLILLKLVIVTIAFIFIRKKELLIFSIRFV